MQKQGSHERYEMQEQFHRADQLHRFVADLGNLKAVQAAAENLMTRTTRLDILANNAGP